MHHGNLYSDSAAGRVWRYLLANRGAWVGGWELTIHAQTSAVSTRVSEVRHQLPDCYRLERKQEGRRFYYRLMEATA